MIIWYTIGIFYLIILTYQDYKNNMVIDQRYNYFMSGATFGLLYLFNLKYWWVLLLLVAITIMFGYICKKAKVMGSGDLKSIQWMIIGFGIISFKAVLWFFIFLGTIWALHYILAKMLEKLLKVKFDRVQGYPILLITFIITGAFLL